MPTLCPLDPRLRIVNASSPIGSFPMAVLSDADIVSKEIATRGYWELKYPSELLHLAGGSRGVELPRPGTFLDIGANLGFYTLLFAQHGYSVLAVEPMLLNRKAIETSLCLNPSLAARLRLMPVALGTVAAVNGKTRCVVRADDRNPGNGKLYCSEGESCGRSKSHTGEHETICEPVRMSTLDDLLNGERQKLSDAPIVATKIDVEGFECNVLSGGRSLLAEFRPKVMVAEANRKPIKACLTQYSEEYGYRKSVWQTGFQHQDVNWILTRERPPVKGTDPQHRCTWLNGCCARHPSVKFCRDSANGRRVHP